jgi:MFS family permease
MPNNPEKKPWWTYLNGYHWYVFTFAAMGWLFDTMDQQIFTASRSITMRFLLPNADFATQTKYGTYATALFIVGWATGGLLFGMVGDRWGRVKTMALTIFIYSAFTGLSGLATTFEVFALGRLITGFGVGGEFAVGAALVAEVMPEKARASALGLLQALSAVGNVMAAKMLGLVVPHWGWQGLYYIGTLPALLALFVFWRMKEPERWVKAKAASALAEKEGRKGEKFGRISELFSAPQWRKNTLVGLCLAIAGVLGLWGAGFWSAELIDATLPTVTPEAKIKFEQVLASPSAAQEVELQKAFTPDEQKKWSELTGRALRPRAVKPDLNTALSTDMKERVRALVAKSLPEKEKTQVKSNALVLQQVAAFFGIYAFSFLASRIGRRKSFFIAFILAWISVVVTFYSFQEKSQIWYLWPILGFGTLMPFGGYAIYFPELFPTRLRTTGTGFCYNVGRYVAAVGPLTLGSLATMLHGRYETPGFKLAAIIVSFAYLIGLVALIWAPETMDKPLPEDEKSFAH